MDQGHPGPSGKSCTQIYEPTHRTSPILQRGKCKHFNPANWAVSEADIVEGAKMDLTKSGQNKQTSMST